MVFCLELNSKLEAALRRVFFLNCLNEYYDIYFLICLFAFFSLPFFISGSFCFLSFFLSQIDKGACSSNTALQLLQSTQSHVYSRHAFDASFIYSFIL